MRNRVQIPRVVLSPAVYWFTKEFRGFFFSTRSNWGVQKRYLACFNQAINYQKVPQSLPVPWLWSLATVAKKSIWFQSPTVYGKLLIRHEGRHTSIFFRRALLSSLMNPVTNPDDLIHLLCSYCASSISVWGDLVMHAHSAFERTFQQAWKAEGRYVLTRCGTLYAHVI